MQSKIPLFSLAVIFLTSCGNSKNTNPKMQETPKDTVEQYVQIKWLSRWMIGVWEMDNNPGKTIESWSQLNDSVLTGESITFGSGKDTLFYETIRIEERGNDLFYIPTVSNQNDGKPVEFKRILLESYPVNGEEVVFENQQHDFPQRISYYLKGDSLIASISGKIEGKGHTERFPMIRSK